MVTEAGLLGGVPYDQLASWPYVRLHNALKALNGILEDLGAHRCRLGSLGGAVGDHLSTLGVPAG